MSEPTEGIGIIGDYEREYFSQRYREIAQLLYEKRLWRGPWSVEIDGCVYKFTVKGYAKKGSKRAEEERAVMEEVLSECFCKFDAMCCPVHDPTGARD